MFGANMLVAAQSMTVLLFSRSVCLLPVSAPMTSPSRHDKSTPDPKGLKKKNYTVCVPYMIISKGVQNTLINVVVQVLLWPLLFGEFL